MGNWKVKVNAPTTDTQHVAGIGRVEPGKWVTLDDEKVARFEAAQGVEIKDMAGGVFEIKDPSGKLVEPPKKEEEEPPEEEEETQEEEGS